ncbi:hypothetical protein, partial [Paucidesulfovibrio gracilis]|uniref:hypothetical protein n=1 Tax=Paucidesulfovibrio gracilis TaxID=47158 RepID=UPI0013564B55
GAARRRVVLLPRFPGWLRPPETRGNGAPQSKRTASAVLLLWEGGENKNQINNEHLRQTAGLELGKVFGKGVQGEEPFFRKVFPLVAEGHFFFPLVAEGHVSDDHVKKRGRMIPSPLE